MEGYDFHHVLVKRIQSLPPFVTLFFTTSLHYVKNDKMDDFVSVSLNLIEI